MTTTAPDVRGSVHGAQTTARAVVHLGLVASFLGAFVPLLLFGLADRNTLHVVVACVFLALVLVHLWQRRHTAARLAVQLVRPHSVPTRARRLARSDLLLVLLVALVLASGTWDLASGDKHDIPGLHGLYLGDHTVASLLLLCYLIAHVIRRRRRFFSSAIR